MKELVIISGKGGTGKTSVTASFAALADKPIIADCDVDAPDLHLILDPQIKERYPFSGGKIAEVISEQCNNCGLCQQHCRYNAVTPTGPANRQYSRTWYVDPLACEGCGVCAEFCPNHAIEMKDAVNGEWYKSQCRFGSMVHARLGVAQENSGKLVTLVRRQARHWAEQQEADLIICDGPPGIGCPVIATINGADFVLLVSEPSLSGVHDLQRALNLVRHFQRPAMLVVNKFDLNPEVTRQMERKAHEQEVTVAGRIPYDPVMVEAQMEGKCIAEYKDSPARHAVCDIWETVQKAVNGQTFSASN
jgi:MinD superfamily P-loop ATPase